MISLRPATFADARLIFEWANSPASLAGKLITRREIPWTEHLSWFEQRLKDPGTSIWVANDGNAAIGQVRLQQQGSKDPNVFDVDIFVTETARRHGYAKEMLIKAAENLAKKLPGAHLRARVLKDNKGSRALFRSLGYRVVAREKDHLVFLANSPMANEAQPSSKGFVKTMALYERALKTIPLATQTFSKSAMSFVVGASPLFLKHGSGCRVWDVDDNEYIDYVSGLLPVLLGYRDPEVDAAIIDQLGRGISFSLATELEAEVSERLVKLIPSAEMVRFGKNGSDVTTAAVRLARAITGRDKIAICGYHGWHDWYIGTTTRDLGVPKAVQELSKTFSYNDIDSLERILKSEPGKFAAIILEPAGLNEPKGTFLQDVRALADRHNVLLIFDEIITGFRASLGGAQAVYGVTPDLSCFGKSMANGMPLSAIVGPRNHMKMMEQIFFSGTFGGETLSLAAARATIDKAIKFDVPARLQKFGASLLAGVSDCIERSGLEDVLSIGGPAWWPRLVVKETKSIERTTLISLIRQETAANGLLIASSFNLCLAHDSEDVLDKTMSCWQSALFEVADAVEDVNPAGRLRGDPIQPVFAVRN